MELDIVGDRPNKKEILVQGKVTLSMSVNAL